LGLKANDNASRVGLWSDIVSYHRQLADIGAIEGFSASDVVVSQGDDKTKVIISDTITPISAMEQLYMTVIVQ